MQKSSTADTRKGLLLTLVVLGLFAALVILPYQFRSEAGADKNANSKGLLDRTEAKEEPMYDIREDQSKEASQALLDFRQKGGKDAVAVANEREKFVRAEAALKQRLPNSKIEYNLDIRIPEIITPDVWRDKIEFLTPPSDVKRSDILRNFIKQNNELVGMTNQQIDSLKTFADYTNPDGNLSFVELNQEINGVPVFRGEVKAGFAKNGQMIRVVNNLAPGLDYNSLSEDFRNPIDAVKAAARHINHELTPADTTRNDARSTDLKVVFGDAELATTAEKMYFPTEPGVAIPAWRVTLQQKVDAYYVMVDAETGTMLWKKNLVADQTQSATYNVYANPNAFIPVHDNPAPLSPGPINPTLGTQGTVIPRINQTRIGNEGAFNFNNNGWINDNTNITDGNAVEAGLDVVAPDGVDAPLTGDTACPGAGCRTFTSLWNPPPAMGGEAPTAVEARRGAVIQMFYTVNWWHDEMYRLGFTEQARNFQHDNFGRGGLANDRIRAEGQDSSGTNNANFQTNADGTRGRMQMYVWTGPTPDYDGTGDAEVIIHEVSHGLSNRIHGNNSGLGNQGAMMGEGWGDWYAMAMLSEPTDPINGIYTTGGYATHQIAAGFTGNYYYGIRRFPKAVIAFTGPNGLPHNPLTFRYINTGCDVLIGTTTSNPPPSSAYPRGPVGGVNQCSQVHNAGEIWSSALWEVRGLMVTRLGWAVGNRKVMQLVTDGMKLAPLNPMMLQERDAIITAAAASSAVPEASADVQDVREGFRRRGMGFSASTQSSTAVTEAFDFPNVAMTNPFSVSDSTGDNDGYPEPGEQVLLSVAVTNTTGGTINNVVGSVAGGGSANYGNIADAQTVTRQIPYTVPANAVCGSMHQVTITISSDVGSQVPQTREFRLGAPVGGAPTTVSNSTAIVIADNAPSAPYPSNITVAGLTGNKILKLNLNGLTHTFPADIDILLVGPGGQKFMAMSDMGGGGDVLTPIDISLSDGAANALSTTQLVAGTFRPGNTDTTTDVFTAPAPAAPYNNPAPAGAATFASSFGSDGSTMNGTWSLYVRDDAGTDIGTLAGGWSLTFEANDFVCSTAPPKSRADFDGDGRTDLSVFRPAEGNWYMNRSTDGFSAVQFGVSADIIVPGNYDSDNKTDVAVFRPSEGNWYLLRSTGGFAAIKWGLNGDIPQPGNFDADPEDELVVYRPSEGNWYITNANGSGFSKYDFGQSGDIPVAGDYTGDGIDDAAVFRPSNATWYVRNSADGSLIIAQFGVSSDMPVPADYNGDGKEDYAVFRPSNGTWYVARPTGIPSQNFDAVQFGASGDVPVPGDYDGDGKDDYAVYRGGTWFLNRSTSGFSSAGFGLASDRAVPKAYIP